MTIAGSCQPLALCPYRMSGTMLAAAAASSTPDGPSFRVNGIDQWTFRDELFCHYVTYYNHAEMVRQLGVPTAPGRSSVT